MLGFGPAHGQLTCRGIFEFAVPMEPHAATIPTRAKKLLAEAGYPERL